MICTGCPLRLPNADVLSTYHYVLGLLVPRKLVLRWNGYTPKNTPYEVRRGRQRARLQGGV